MSGQPPPVALPSTPGSRFGLGPGLWVALALLTVGFFSLTLVFRPLTDVSANTASVWGLWVTAVRFALTLWTVYQTKRVAEATRQETRAVVEKIALQFLQAECQRAYHHIADALRAAEAEKWERMVDKMREAQRDAVRVCQFGPLSDAERRLLQEGVESLAIAAEFIRVKIMSAGAVNLLPPKKARELDKTRGSLQQMLTTLDYILARLQQLVLETPHAG